MRALSDRFHYLFGSTKGLTLVAAGILGLIAALFGMLSGPMVEWGITDIIVRLFRMDLVQSEREGRIIMLYHSIAMIVVAIEVYLITDIVKMRKHQQSMINATVTAGYLFALFGLVYAYWGHNPIWHGLFLVGQSLMFFGGILFSVALWPWRSEYHIPDDGRARSRKGVDLERVAFFVMAVATLGSAIFGAVAGAYFGSGFESFLAEDTIRETHKTTLQLAVIGHLHIMVTLVAVAIALIVGRWMDFRGIWHKLTMPFMIFGTIVITLGVWAVVPYEAIAHWIIYVGSVFILFGGLFLVIFTWDKLIGDRIAELGIEKPNARQKIKALLHDPLKFGATWQMVFMNFTTTFVGLFMAIKLEEIMRVWPAREERITLTGHWHILSTLIATIILFYFADMMNLRGKARKWFGWVIIIGSDLAFGAMTLFAIKRLFMSEAGQQPLVNWTMLAADLGLFTVLVALATFLVWRLVDLFKKQGHWSRELADADVDHAA